MNGPSWIRTSDQPGRVDNCCVSNYLSRTVLAPFNAHGSPEMRIGRICVLSTVFSCVPSPCTGHYSGRLGTMNTPSPCTFRRLGDPQVPLHITSVRRFPVRPACSSEASRWRRSLVSLITALTNSTLRRLGFKQFSLNHIQRSCLIFQPDFYRSCYCSLQVSHPGKTLL